MSRCRPFPALDEPLRDLWRRRPDLTRAEWGQLYGIVQRVLSAQYLERLSALPGNPDEYIQDYFEDKVFRFGKPGGHIDHTCALVVFFDRYLVSRLRDPFLKGDRGRSAEEDEDAPPDPVELETNRQAVEDFASSDLNLKALQELLDLATDAVARPTPASEEGIGTQPLLAIIEDYLGLALTEVMASARRFLAGHGEWARLEADLWWIRLYLHQHFCAEREHSLALDALARRHQVRSYHHKAGPAQTRNQRPAARRRRDERLSNQLPRAVAYNPGHSNRCRPSGGDCAGTENSVPSCVVPAWAPCVNAMQQILAPAMQRPYPYSKLSTPGLRQGDRTSACVVRACGEENPSCVVLHPR